MRALAGIACVVVLALAGCGGKSTETTTSTTVCLTAAGASDSCGPCQPVCSTTTTQAPNDPPVVSLIITSGGIALPGNVTMVGTNVTFDASRTTDDDGDGLLLVAIGATDGNRTYPPQVLYQSGEFTLATYTFDRAGPVNVTVEADDQGGGQSFLHTVVFVDEKTALSEDFSLSGPPAPVGDATTCSGPSGQTSIDPAMWKPAAFPVQKGAMYVVAKVTGGSASIAICDPGGNAISPAGSDTVTSNKGTVFAPPLPGEPSYFISIISGAAAQTVGVDVTVHYEAQP